MNDLGSDIDPVESREWQDAIADVIERDGAGRAHYLLDKAVQQARAAGANLPFSATTPYQNTIPVDDQYDFPGDIEMEWRIRSRPDRYGSVAVSLHWLSAVAVFAMLVTGFRAAGTADPVAQAGLLRVHVPLGLTILALTVLRIVWWLAFDRKPEPIAGTPAWQDRLARLTHGALYLVLLGMLGSGMALMVLSGAGEVVFGGMGTLPDFSDFAPRIPHGLGAMLLMVLILLHVGAALYHHAIRGDGIFRRMWYGDAAPTGRD